MSASASRRLRDGMLSIASLSVVVAGVAIINENARHAIGEMLAGTSPIPVRVPDLRFAHLMRYADVFGLPAGSETPLLLFAAAAFVLFILMFRT